MTIQERLEAVAMGINQRYGQYPDADTIREAITHINTLEDSLKSKPVKAASTPKVKS